MPWHAGTHAHPCMLSYKYGCQKNTVGKRCSPAVAGLTVHAQSPRANAQHHTNQVWWCTLLSSHPEGGRGGRVRSSWMGWGCISVTVFLPNLREALGLICSAFKIEKGPQGSQPYSDFEGSYMRSYLKTQKSKRKRKKKYPIRTPTFFIVPHDLSFRRYTRSTRYCL